MTEAETEAAFAAARSGDLDALSSLLESQPGLVRVREGKGATLLHVAAERDDVPLATLLLDRDADPEAQASWGYTPFEWAAAMASAGVARLLLARGAGRLDLWTAAALGMIEEVRTRFEGGAPLPGVGRAPRPGADLSGWPEDTPYRTGDVVSDTFHIAARNGHREVAALLLDAGADVDATGYFGATALHWAAIAGRDEIVRWLVGVGANVHLRDPKFDATPAGWAREGGNTELAEFLESTRGIPRTERE